MPPPSAPISISAALLVCISAAAADDGGSSSSAPRLSLDNLQPVSTPIDPHVLHTLTSTDPQWTVQVEPSFWYVSPSGDVKLPVSSGSGPGSFTTSGDSVDVARLNLDTPRFEPSGEIHLSAERWRFNFSGSTFSIDRNDTPADAAFRLGSVVVAAGDPLDVQMDFTSIEITAGYRVWGRLFSSPVFSQCPENCTDSLVRVYVIGGGRFTDIGFDVTRDTPVRASAGFDDLFAEPIVGARVEIDLAADFTLDLQLSGGGLPLDQRSSFSFDIQAGFHWRPHPNLGLQIGYRQLVVGLADGEGADEFEYDGRFAGLFAGLVLRF